MNSIEKNRISIYSEFDGVIIENHFKDYLLNDDDKKINSIFSKNNISNAIDKYYIDSNFKVFAEYCRNLNIELNIISDGFIDLISPVLDNIFSDDSNYFTCFANSLNFDNDNVNINIYGASESCNCKKFVFSEDIIKNYFYENKSCKRNKILSNCEPENIIAYIGDGYYDTCMAEYSDIIFAKGKLSAYCNKNRIPHYNYKNYFDIYRIFKEIIEKKRFKIRHQAFLNRKKAFEYE
jgi:2-hydroxy-3-keto-5-methylthiopentenyl-1-phosphate phosphatase